MYLSTSSPHFLTRHARTKHSRQSPSYGLCSAGHPPHTQSPTGRQPADTALRVGSQRRAEGGGHTLRASHRPPLATASALPAPLRSALLPQLSSAQPGPPRVTPRRQWAGRGRRGERGVGRQRCQWVVGMFPGGEAAAPPPAAAPAGARRPESFAPGWEMPRGLLLLAGNASRGPRSPSRQRDGGGARSRSGRGDGLTPLAQKRSLEWGRAAAKLPRLAARRELCRSFPSPPFLPPAARSDRCVRRRQRRGALGEPLLAACAELVNRAGKLSARGER